MTGAFEASFSGKMNKYCSCVMVEIRKCQSLRVTSLGTSSRPDGLGIIAGFGSRITLLGSKNFCKTITPFMSLLLMRVSRGPLYTYPSTLCVYHVPIYMGFNKNERSIWWREECGLKQIRSELELPYANSNLLIGDAEEVLRRSGLLGVEFIR